MPVLRINGAGVHIGGKPRVTDEALKQELRSLIPEAGFTVRGLSANPDYKALLASVQSMDCSTDEECGRMVSALCSVSEGFDLPTQIALRAVAESVDWPPYTLGDGYWIEASDNSAFLTGLGMGFSVEDSPLMSDIAEERAPGFGFIALGMAANQVVPRNVIMSLVNFEDPVVALASTHPSLDRVDIETLLHNVENGAWVAELVLGREGWPWLDWKDAFTIASEGCRKSSVFWEVLLSGMAGERPWSWFDDFLYEFEDGCEPSELDDLAQAMSSNPELVDLARKSSWIEAAEVAEGVSAN